MNLAESLAWIFIFVNFVKMAKSYQWKDINFMKTILLERLH